MASKIELAIETLKMSLGRENPAETLRLLERIVQPFDDAGSLMTGPEIDLGISKVFDTEQGLLTFLTRSMQCKKLHRDANCRVLELFDRIICGDHRVRLAGYAEAISNVMLQYMLSGSVSALEKERATQVLQSLVVHNLCAQVQMGQVLEQVLSVFHNGKATGKFLQHVYVLLGQICRCHPESMQSLQAFTIRNTLLKPLESVLLTQNSLALATVIGAFQGLNAFLVNFAPSPDSEPDVCRRIYVCCKRMSDPPADFRQLQVYQASLDLIAEHAGLLAPHIYADHQYWHALLHRWLLNTTNREYRKTAFAALNSVHTVIANCCCESSLDDTGAVLQQYVNHFKSILMQPLSKAHEIRIAIRGLGLMAAACSARLPAENLADMLSLVLQRARCEESSAAAASNREDHPDVVRALSQIMQHVRQLSNEQVHSLRGALVSLMREFCYLPQTYHRMTVATLLQTFVNLQLVGAAIAERLLGECTMHALVWTCSHKLQLDAQLDWEWQADWKAHISVQSFRELWLGLTVDVEATGEGGAAAEDVAAIRVVKRRVYAHILEAFFVIVERLDLRLRRREASDGGEAETEGGGIADALSMEFVDNPNRDLEPVRPADFHLFFNVVQLYELVLGAQSAAAQEQVFRGTVARFCALLARKCRQHPLVSGFVRLMTIGLHICSKLQYFEGTATASAGTVACVQQFVRAQLEQVGRAQGEMQIASLRALFAAPMQCMQRFSVAELVLVYRSAFDVGRAELAVARAALASLQRFVQQAIGDCDELLQEVLPALDGYLQSRGGVVGRLGELKTVRQSGKRGAGHRAKKRVVSVTESEGDGDDVDLLRFQKSVLMFLGTLKPSQCLHLIGTDFDDAQTHRPIGATSPSSSHNITRLQLSDSIRLTLHFDEYEPHIHLDSLMPRICALATESGDRHTKLAACELLHASALYVIGSSNFDSAIWRTLCSHMLRLGSDGDAAVRQMFEPLLEQTMHYLAHPSNLTVANVRSLLDSLMLGCSEPRCTAVRDMAARCLRIFVEWTGRQNAANTSLVVTELVTRMRAASLDSAASRRSGAALAFNSVYRLLREHNELINIIWMDVLHMFAVNMQLSEQFGAAERELQPQSLALDRVMRVLRERAAMFAVTGLHRTVPAGWGGATIAAACRWLFAGCGAVQTHFRRKCMALVQQLVPHIPTYKSLAAYMQKEHSVESLLVIGQLTADATLPALLTALDFFAWVIADGLFKESAVLLQRSGIPVALAAFLRGAHSTIVAGQQTELHALGVQRAFEFMLRVMTTQSAAFGAEDFWVPCSQSIGDLLVLLVFEPQAMATEVDTRLVEKFLKNYARAFNTTTSQVITKRLGDQLTTRIAELLATTEMYMYSTLIPLPMLNSARGIRTLLASGHAPPESASCAQLIQLLFDGLREQRSATSVCAHQMAPDLRSYARSLLRLACDYGGDAALDQLMECVFDTTALVLPDTGSVILHGQHFLNVFDSPIYENWLRAQPTVVSKLSSRVAYDTALFVAELTSGLLRFSRRKSGWEHNRAVRRELAANVAVVFEALSALVPNPTAETLAIPFAIFDVCTETALIWPDALIGLGQQLPTLRALLIAVIDKAELPLDLKARAVFLLPCILDSIEDSLLDVEHALVNMQNQHFPLQSTEFPEGSLKRNAYVGIMRAVLDAMVASRSPVLLKFVLGEVITDNDEHLLAADVRRALTKVGEALATGGTSQALVVLRIPVSFFAELRLEPRIRLNALRWILLPLLNACGTEAAVKFYGEHLSTILKWSNANYAGAPNAHHVAQALVARIGAYRLIEQMAGSIGKERLQSDAELVRTLPTPTKSLIGMLTTKTIGTRAEIFVTDNAASAELFRQYNCATFAAICTLVANTQTELPYFEKLLFKENTARGEYIWRRIIDCRESASYTLHLSAEFAELPHRRERLVCIAGRNKASQLQRGAWNMQTQNVYESSFSQDVTKIDLSHSAVRSGAQVPVAQNVIVLEHDRINENEAMAVLCAVVRAMFEKGITPLPDAALGETCRPAPAWARHLCTVLRDATQPRNTRYFIAKLVDNCRELFANYAATMTEALLNFLADECSSELGDSDAAGNINYLFIDLTVTLLEWSDRYKLQTAEERMCAGTVLRFLMMRAWHERRDLFRQRLECVRQLIVAWVTPEIGVALPRQLLIDSLQRSAQTDSRDNLCGLQLNAIVLCSSDELPWTELVCLPYVQRILANLDNEHSSIYQPAGYLLGMVLSRLVPADQDSDENVYLQPLLVRLNKWRQSRADEKRFIDVLFAVHRNYPRIVVGFLVPIANLIPKTIGAVKSKYLDMFLAGMDVYGADMFRELLSMGIVDLLRSVEHQLQALHCVNKALPSMSDAQRASLIDDLLECARSSNAEIRAVCCEIFVYILVNAVDAPLQTVALQQLLRALSDRDERIRQRAFEFWSNCDQLPRNVDGRILGVLDVLYDPAVETKFIGYGTQLLLQVAVLNARAKQPIFPHHQLVELSSGSNVGGSSDNSSPGLSEYQIDVSWSGRNCSMRAPLFVPSQQQRQRSAIVSGELLATATDSQLAFEPTQDPTQLFRAPMDHFTAATNGSQSAMLFAIPSQTLDRRSHRMTQASGQAPTDNRQRAYSQLRERFLTSQDDTARKWVDKARTKQIIQSKQRSKPNRNIQLYRRYRRGDFPDLLLNNLAFLMPLQALVVHDRQLASQLFVDIYTAVAAVLDPPDNTQFLVASSDFVHIILQQTRHCDRLVCSTLLQLAMQHPKHFQLPAELVTSLALTNRTHALAIGYLERRLQSGWDTDAGPGSSSKTNSTTVDVEHQHWLKLSELYRALAEPDVAAGIFADKLDVDGRVPRALALESNGDLEAAQRVYADVIERGKVLELDFAYASYFELYANMGDWSALANSCEAQMDGPLDAIWSDEWQLDTLLPHLMRARCRQMLAGDEASAAFVRGDLAQWVRLPERAAHLNVQFGEELQMMHMAAGQWRHARVYGDRRLAAFLAEWPTLHVLTRKVRAEKVQQIRTVAEMQECAGALLAVDGENGGSCDQLAEQLASRWTSDRPIAADTALLWDSLVAYRGCVANAATGDPSLAPTAVARRLQDAVAASQFRLLHLALTQRNVALANRIVQIVPRGRNELRWLVTRAEHQSLKAAVLGRSPAAQCKLQLKAWDGISAVLQRDQEMQQAEPEVRLRALEVLGSICSRLVKITHLFEAENSASWIGQIGERLGQQESAADQLNASLYKHAFEQFHKRVQFVQSQSETPTSTAMWFEGQDRGTVYFQLAAFCQDHGADLIPNCDRIILESLFKSMQFGCPRARQMFPRILDLPALHTTDDDATSLQRIFAESAEQVPAWMFLGWIPQMLSVFTFDRACFLDSLLLRIAQSYPFAVCYPFRLTLSQRTEEAEIADGNELKPSECSRQLLQVLHNPAANAFVLAMLALAVPEKKLLQHVRNLYMELDAHEDEEDARFLRRCVRRLIRTVWPEDQVRGWAYERLDEFREDLEALNMESNLRDAQELVEALLTRIEAAGRTKAYARDTLRSLSPWLASFQWSGGLTDQPLEMPGQYSGQHRPNPAEHVRIIKFDESIRIFETLRQPIRLSICGTDGRTNAYLLKYGEDLRQDQRIQQLLALMQQQLSADRHCRSHALRLETYAVIPLSVHCGLLGWVDDSPAMQSVVERHMRRHPVKPAPTSAVAATDTATTQSATALLRSLRVEHEQFIKAASHGLNETRALHFYGHAAHNYTRVQVHNALRAIEYKLPTELLRAALWDMAATAEAFFALRTNFASSLAALSVAHWLLGIGDRHLSNVLLNMRSARVVGIDFGMSFGAGTRDQSVPELLPFRMTPQLVQVMSPLGTCGTIKAAMTHALRCLRSAHRLLESCMEVFVREPSIDWLQSARNRALVAEAGGEAQSAERSAQWDATQRIEIARRKLRGANPRAVCAEELANSKVASHTEYLAGYQRLVAGHEQHNARAQLPDDGLTADEQVRCLLDMATDPALLGLSWSGMQTWI